MTSKKLGTILHEVVTNSTRKVLYLSKTGRRGNEQMRRGTAEIERLLSAFKVGKQITIPESHFGLLQPLTHTEHSMDISPSSELENLDKDILLLADLAELLGLKIRTIQNRICRGDDMPPSTLLSARHRVWSKATVLNWILAREKDTNYYYK